MQVTLHVIEADLALHGWYVDLVRETIAAVERYLASWAAFEDYLEASASGARNG